MNIIGAELLLALILKSHTEDFKQRMCIGLMAGFAISLIPSLMNWNWWHFPVPFTLITIVDDFIMWALASLVMIKITTKKTSD